MARSVHSYQAYIFAEQKARQIWRGNYETEGHISRQISADIRKTKGNITLTPTLFFYNYGQEVRCTHQSWLFAGEPAAVQLVCWVMYAAENLKAIDESYKVWVWIRSSLHLSFFLFRQQLTCLFTVKREKICFHSLNKKKWITWKLSGEYFVGKGE